jgi:hypothetical protein
VQQVGKMTIEGAPVAAATAQQVRHAAALVPPCDTAAPPGGRPIGAATKPCATGQPGGRPIGAATKPCATGQPGGRPIGAATKPCAIGQPGGRPIGAATKPCATAPQAAEPPADAGGSGQAVALAVGVVALPVVAWSEFTLVSTGCGLPPGPGGALGALEGLCYVGMGGLLTWSLVSRINTGKGLPAGDAAAGSRIVLVRAAPAAAAAAACCARPMPCAGWPAPYRAGPAPCRVACSPPGGIRLEADCLPGNVAPAGHRGALGAVEGLSWLVAIAGIAALTYQVRAYACTATSSVPCHCPSALPDAVPLPLAPTLTLTPNNPHPGPPRCSCMATSPAPCLTRTATASPRRRRHPRPHSGAPRRPRRHGLPSPGPRHCPGGRTRRSRSLGAPTAWPT